MISLTRFESNLMRLGWIGDRLAIIYEQFPNIKQPIQNYNFKSTTTEYAIIQLWNFIKIRESLLKDFKDNGQPLLDKCLMPMWVPILEHKKAIKEIRHKYIAHLQETKKPFNPFIEEIIQTENFPNTVGDLRLMFGCGWGYQVLVKSVFKEEWKKASKKYTALRPIYLPHGVLKPQAVQKFLNKYTNEVIENLKKNGLPIPNAVSTI